MLSKRQVAPQDMFRETNTKCNLPAQIDLYATKGDAYKFMFVAKGGGSANKTFLYQQTKALLNEKSLMAFVEEKVRDKQARLKERVRDCRLHLKRESETGRLSKMHTSGNSASSSTYLSSSHVNLHLC